MAYRTDPANGVEGFSNSCEWTPVDAETTARHALEGALHDLLDVAQRRGGYSPREFIARRRAKQALRRAELPRQPSSAADRSPAGSA